MTRRSDPVTAELAADLWARDIGCTLSFLDPGHVCTDRWGTIVGWRDAVTIEHVKTDLRMGRRAPSDLEHCVLLCAGSNVGVPSKRERALMREYLAARRVA